jgi:hypothetical protein
VKEKTLPNKNLKTHFFPLGMESMGMCDQGTGILYTLSLSGMKHAGM